MAELDLISGTHKAFTSYPVRLNRLGTSRPGVLPFGFQIPLADIRPGAYVAQANVIDEVGRSGAFLRNSIVVLARAD